MDTEFCSSCCVMLRMVLRNAIKAKITSCSTARKMMAFSVVKPGCQGPRSIWMWSRLCSRRTTMPCTTALISSLEV